MEKARPIVEYKPVDQRTPDWQTHTLLKNLKERGEIIPTTQQGEGARRLIGPQIVYDLTNGFPDETLRAISNNEFRQATGEILAFCNGVHTQEILKEFGCVWWEPWVSEEKCKKRGLPPGDLGLGSYGPAYHDIPMPDGTTFNQWEHLEPQMKELPHLRTHTASTLTMPYYNYRHSGTQQRTVVVPCHGTLVHFFLDPDGSISLHHVQRSGDIPVGVVYNIIQYALLLLIFAQLTRRTAKKLYITISDAHFYDRQEEFVDILLGKTPQPFSTVTLDPEINKFSDFRHHHIYRKDYNATNGKLKIPTPI